MKPKPNDENHTEEEENGIDENEPVDFDFQKSNSKLNKTHSENSNSQNTLSKSDSSVSSQFEWQEGIDQDTYTDTVIHTEQATKQSFENIEKGEKAVSVVHSPLKVKKKKTTILQQPQKTYMSPKSNKTRPKNVIHASRTQINSEELAIGSVTPGKRQLTGATESPKPILPQKSLHAIVNLQVLKPLEPLESAMTTTNYEDYYASKQPVTSKNLHGSPLSSTLQKQRKVQNHQPQLFYAENDNNGLSETVRITKYDVEGVTQKMTPKSSYIAPSISEQQLSSSQQHISQHMLLKMAEVHKIMVRLREKIVKLQAKLDKKTKIIRDLKKKLADSYSENKHQKLAILKAEDESKRAVHRFDSLKVRYDIIFKELSTKDDDLTECKREIYELRKIATPAASSLSHLRNSQDEQLRILQEKERQKGMISLARSAMTNVTSTEAQRHLNMFMRNTKKSISRLEAKRRIWKEVEKKQVMGALGALSLIDDKKSLFSLKKSISTIYDSPFKW